MHATSSSICPPPIISVASRGKWSLGKVLDLHWKWDELDNYYLNHMMASLNVKSQELSKLPPHFSKGIEI